MIFIALGYTAEACGKLVWRCGAIGQSAGARVKILASPIKYLLHFLQEGSGRGQARERQHQLAI